MKFPLPSITLAICAAALSTSLQLQAGTVTNTDDSGSGSLRDAITAATIGVETTIDFAPALNGATITLTSGELSITGIQLTIDASALAEGISLSGNDSQRIFVITGNANVTLRKLDIRNGSAPAPSPGGGAIAIVESQLHMSDCAIRDSFATYNGGGMLLSLGSISTFDRCRIMGNTASNLGYGGGAFIGGATSAVFRNCLITGNSNPLGGGLSVSNSSPSLINCTVEGNSGGGMRNNSNADPTLENCIFWGNLISGSGVPASQQVSNFNSSNPMVSFSLIQGASGPESFQDGDATIWGMGNLNGTLEANDPKFATGLAAPSPPHAAGDLLLLATSPALNVGNNLADIGSMDLVGNPRIQAVTVDLGAFEGGFVTFGFLHPSLTPSEDANHNGIPNLQEYAMGFDPAAIPNPGAQPTFSREEGISYLTVNCRSNALDITTALETSTDLVSPWSAMIENVHYYPLIITQATAERKSLKFQLNTLDPVRFYRQRFTQSN